MKELVYVLPAIIVIIVVAIFAYKAKIAKREEPLKTEGTEEKKEALFVSRTSTAELQEGYWK